MNFLNKLERKLGRYAISNLTLYIIGTYILGYLLQFFAGNLIEFFYLDPYLILHGQVWRLVTWLFVPPWQFSILILITLWFYYSIGNTLERSWGTFRYNFYIFGGILTTILGAFVLYGISSLIYGPQGGQLYSHLYAGAFSTYYISMSIFLGFALTYPDMQVLLMFLIPIKMKYLAVLDVALLTYSMIQPGSGWGIRVVIISSLLNVVIFFFCTRRYHSISPKEVHRKQVYRRQMRQASGITKHKCAVCGRTEKDGDNLEFRFCSKCEGNYEYCQDHLFTHTHRKRNS
ncbi:MAG: rhomboid family intramembrane serine protease [Lachnospiraceae bacterium]|nr:rhomboid family intramembrane serine protease [Lachnospiraceae bacterium]